MMNIPTSAARFWLVVVACALVSACGEDTTDPQAAAMPAPEPPPAANSPPTISGQPSAQVMAGAAYDFRPSASDPDGDSLTFNVQNKPAWASFSNSTGRLSGTPAAGNVGTYSNIVIRVSDGTVSTSLPGFAISVVDAPPPANSAPTISGQPLPEVVAGAAYDFRPGASDPDGDSLTFSVQNRPAWASFSTSTGRLNGTPAAADVGTYSNIVIRVSDGTASASLPGFAIRVVQAANGSATLRWVPPTTRSDGSALVDLAGFNVFYGQSSGNYSNQVRLDNPGLTAYVIENLASGTWFFAMTAFDSQDIESSRSTEASKTIP